jgi:acetolactate synthase-1/2/3 large subunit
METVSIFSEITIKPEAPITEPAVTYINGSQALMRALVAEGVETIFGYPGGAIMPVYDALYDFQDRINHILVRHEQGAAHAARDMPALRVVPASVWSHRDRGQQTLLRVLPMR